MTTNGGRDAAPAAIDGLPSANTRQKDGRQHMVAPGGGSERTVPEETVTTNYGMRRTARRRRLKDGPWPLGHHWPGAVYFTCAWAAVLISSGVSSTVVSPVRAPEALIFSASPAAAALSGRSTMAMTSVPPKAK